MCMYIQICVPAHSQKVSGCDGIFSPFSQSLHSLMGSFLHSILSLMRCKLYETTTVVKSGCVYKLLSSDLKHTERGTGRVFVHSSLLCTWKKTSRILTCVSMKIDAWYVCILCYGICIPTGNCSVRSYLLLYGPGLHKDLSKMDIEDCRFRHKNSLPGSAMNPWVAVTGLLNSSYFSRLVLKICSTSRRLCCVSDLMD